jgi:hypothetical protein
MLALGGRLGKQIAIPCMMPGDCHVLPVQQPVESLLSGTIRDNAIGTCMDE